QPFYSMRDVAAFFQMTLPDVARVFRQLDGAGLLVVLRGSMTLLRARKAQPREPIRGVVGLAVWLDGFATLPYWRWFFVNLEEQLRRHRFVADFVFYSADEFSMPEFAERLT